MVNKKKSFDRFSALLLIMVFIFASIISRLGYLQIVKADYYQDAVANSSSSEIEEFAPRGEITDRNGIKLATNQQSFILTFAETDESRLHFYETMDKLFKILDDNKETQKDDFELTIGKPFSFQFKTEDEDARKQLELRFKKDRGLDEQIKRNLFPKKKDKLTADENDQVDEELLKISAEDTFKYLVETLYSITPDGIFKTYAELYKKEPETALDVISKNYSISSRDEIKNLLDQYKNDKKNSKQIFKELLAKCNVDKKPLTAVQQRRYMLVKDALRMQSFSDYKPVTIANNIKRETAILISEQLNDLPGVDVSIQPVRSYPFAQLGSGFLGYISKITSRDKNDVEIYEEKGYNVNTDYIGVTGIESAFENVLRGSKGAKIVKLNSQGRVMENLGVRETYPGDTVQLTIDGNVQYAAEVALDKVMKSLQAAGRQKDVDTSNATRGAAVAIDVNTGAVLALVSRPGFDPSDFATPGGLSMDNYKKYFNQDLVAYGKSRGLSDSMINKLFPVSSKTKKREDLYDYLPKPLFNYATQSRTPPGSAFKPITGIAGLETGVINPYFKVNDQAYFSGGGEINPPYTFPSDGPNGWVNLNSALAKSSNPYFMTVAQKLKQAYGEDKLAEYAWKFGLGVKPNSGTAPATGIELPEAFGQTSNTWSLKNTFAQYCWWSVQQMLNSGKGYSYLYQSNNNFQPVNLYDAKILDDTEDIDKNVEKIQKDIQAQIQEFVMTDGANNNIPKYLSSLEKLISQLVTTDTRYEGKKFSTSEIKIMVQDIIFIALDSYSQARYPVNLYNASIGQGISQFTPLQLANYVATLANGGTRYKVHIVDKVIDPNGKIVQQNTPEIMEKTGVSQSTIDAVKAGMLAVNDTGTARGVFDGFPYVTAGKTGSATYSNKQDEVGRTAYAVYVGFAPVDKPRIAVAINVFDGGHGSFVATVARAMYEAYFKKELDAMGYTPVNDIAAKPVHDN